jgi:hypothetical protein
MTAGYPRNALAKGVAMPENPYLWRVAKLLPLIFPAASIWFYRDKQREIDFLIEYGGALIYRSRRVPDGREGKSWVLVLC